MKKLLSLGGVFLLAGMAAVCGPTFSTGQDLVANGPIKDHFFEAGGLGWLEQEGADGKIHRADCTGLLVYARDGHTSVQVMYRNPQPGTSAAPVQYAQG